MTHHQERQDEKAHEQAMEAIHDAVLAFRSGTMSYERASAAIGRVLAMESARPARIGNTYEPEIQT